MGSWTLQDAKARFSEVVDRALREGPQIITRHGEKTVVIVAYRDFEGAPPEGFKNFLTSVPLAELNLKRKPRHSRKTMS